MGITTDVFVDGVVSDGDHIIRESLIPRGGKLFMKIILNFKFTLSHTDTHKPIYIYKI